MKFQIQDIQELLQCWSQGDLKEWVPQIAHRMELVEMWQPQQGAQILEVGCGQAETTTVLALAVGSSGHVLAIDKAPPEYGTPPIGEVHRAIMASSLGSRITFQVSTDIMSPTVEFPSTMFDMAVLSHSSWYLTAPEELQKIMERLRPWAKQLAYAEWDIVPQNIMQVPHMLAVLLQVHLKALLPHLEVLNVGSLILPQDVRSMAETAGWSIVVERRIGSSTMLKDGKGWEIQNALHLVEEYISQRTDDVSQYASASIIAEAKLLSAIASETSMMSLSTYAFLAD